MTTCFVHISWLLALAGGPEGGKWRNIGSARVLPLEAEEEEEYPVLGFAVFLLLVALT